MFFANVAVNGLINLLNMELNNLYEGHCTKYVH